MVRLAALHHQVILPELANIVAQRQSVEILNEAVSHAVVVEVVAGHLSDLLAQVARQPTHPEDHENLLQQVKIAIHRLAIECQGGG